MMGPDGDGEQLSKATVFVVERVTLDVCKLFRRFASECCDRYPACLGTKGPSVVAILGSDPVMA